MPGHIGGQGITADEIQAVAQIDLTEVPGTDDLHLPVDVIAQAKVLMAEAFAASESLFLVNGATSGIHALFMTVAAPGKKVLIPRNAHRSFFGGLVLSGAIPVYIPCQIEENLGIAVSVNSSDLADLLVTNQDAAAVFLTSPSYYGTTCDINELSSVCKAAEKLLLVDEAHGAHFYFHSGYPQGALQGGADVVVHGFHKTLPVLNQGGCLHTRKGFNFREQLFSSYSLLTSTSPSYPILASIDLARQFMVNQGEIFLDKALSLSRIYKDKINAIKGLKCYLEQDLRKIPGVYEVDPLKVLVGTQGLAIDGFGTASLLRREYGIQVEIEDSQYILAMFSMFHNENDWNMFYQAMQQIAARYRGKKKAAIAVEKPPYPEVGLSPREAFFNSGKKRVRIEEAAGLVSGEMIAAYPPGIPCLLPGELISFQIIDYLMYLKKTGVRIQGAEDPGLNRIVVCE